MTTSQNSSLLNIDGRTLLQTRAALRAIASIAKCTLNFKEVKGTMSYTVAVFGTGSDKEKLIQEFDEFGAENGLYTFLVKRAYNQILVNAKNLEKSVTQAKGRTIRTSGTAARLNAEFSVLGEYAAIFGLHHDGSIIAPMPTQEDAQEDA